jgi:hypothetical protein
MGKIASDSTDGTKMFSADVVAAVLMASGTISLSTKQYEMMSALDGTRTASGFQHAFRSVIGKAKDLKARVDAGETFEPVQPTKSRSKSHLLPTLLVFLVVSTPPIRVQLTAHRRYNGYSVASNA